MKDTIQKRLATLRSEHETGQKMLAELDAKRANLTQTLLRIEGAIQILTEMEAADEGAAAQPQAARNGAHAAPLA
jgi:septal ring factor EnvC (AmiA/AmiB activator)